MKSQILFALAIVFSVLTFFGAGFVLVNKGSVNAGYACVPMIVALAFSLAYQKCKRKK